MATNNAKTESSSTRRNEPSTVSNTVDNTAAPSAPMNSEPPAKNEIAIPGNMVCVSASATKACRRINTNVPTNPAITANRQTSIRARCMNGSRNISGCGRR